jgi:Polyketide cyclase / dehydrase and lipid transport
LKTLIARLPCSAVPRDAWAALAALPWWLDTLDSVDAVDVDVEGEAHPGVGSSFTVRLQEGLGLRCRVVAVDPERCMELAVRWRVLRAVFTYEIVPLEDRCELVHTRSYGGIATRAIATLWRPREEEEQSATLREWCWEAGSLAARRRYAG